MNEQAKKDFVKRIEKEPTVRRKMRLLQEIAYSDNSIEPVKK